MNKNAITFGDARNMINEAKRRNIKLTRDPIGRLKQKVLGIQSKIKNSLISHLKKKPWVR